MIKNQWYAVMEGDRIRPGQVVSAVRLGKRLAFFRTQDGKAHAVEDKCAHRGARLSQGKVMGDHIACPFHGLVYSPEGNCTFIPANGLANQEDIKRFHVAPYPVEEKGGMIFLWYGDGPAQGHPDLFSELEGLTYDEIRVHWPVHYSRVIENQIDVNHLPFVHRTTIGRGGKTLAHGPRVEWVDDKTVLTSANNEVDEGQRQKSSEEAVIKKTNLKFKFPNMWLNTIIPGKMYVFAYFIPATEKDTILALRYYNKVTPLVPLNKVIARLGSQMNRVVQNQDRRVVQYQRPYKTMLKGTGDTLLQADGPIIAYRKKRHELMEEAGQVRDTDA